jgi:hypothetical protein
VADINRNPSNVRLGLAARKQEDIEKLWPADKDAVHFVFPRIPPATFEALAPSDVTENQKSSPPPSMNSFEGDS